MKVKELMSPSVIRISAEESVAVASRMLAHYNIGALPVCGKDGTLQGLLTDRDIVTRCLAAGRAPEGTAVKQIMTSKVHTVSSDADAGTAAHLMGRQQIRRLPVVENGKLCGMLSLGDLAQSEDTAYDASDALSGITSNISER